MSSAWAINTGLSVAAGAALTAIIGFGWGGWMSAAAANHLAVEAADAALAATWTPHCLAQANAESSKRTIAELKVTFRRNRPAVIQNAGWATPIGETDPSWPVSRACALALAAQWGENK